MTAYYNENDPKAAAWLRELIRAGLIAPGDVDTRSIEDVLPSDLACYTQHHFFAGIGGWSYALRLVGWPDDAPVWTGSCPCQPFSAAGKGKGFADERHLWPAWFHLICECRPERIFGEQVAHNLAWLDLVSRDLEVQGYTVGAAIVGAHSVGAPHIRQRLYWMAVTDGGYARTEGEQRGGQQRQQPEDSSTLDWLADNSGSRCNRSEPTSEGKAQDQTRVCGLGANSSIGDLADARGPEQHRLSSLKRSEVPAPRGGGDLGYASGPRSGGHSRAVFGTEGSVGREVRNQSNKSESPSADSGLADTHGAIPELAPGSRARSVETQSAGPYSEPNRPSDSGWDRAEFIWCRDGKWRPVEPGTFPLAHGIPGRVGLLRGYGNAIVPQDAAAFIKAACG